MKTQRPYQPCFLTVELYSTWLHFQQNMSVVSGQTGVTNQPYAEWTNTSTVTSLNVATC